MCGVIGYRPPINPLDIKYPAIRDHFTRLMLESRIRGTHAYGIAMTYMDTFPIAYRSTDVEQIIAAFDPAQTTIAHTRYSTSGDWQKTENNQPIVVKHLALAFNGVISMGTREEFQQEFSVLCDSDNDGEIFLRRMIKGEAPDHFIGSITGSFAGVWIDKNRLLAGRNERRPLWKTRHLGAVWYASTADIFKRSGFNSELLEEVPVGVELT